MYVLPERWRPRLGSASLLRALIRLLITYSRLSIGRMITVCRDDLSSPRKKVLEIPLAFRGWLAFDKDLMDISNLL